VSPKSQRRLPSRCPLLDARSDVEKSTSLHTSSRDFLFTHVYFFHSNVFSSAAFFFRLRRLTSFTKLAEATMLKGEPLNDVDAGN